MGANIDVARVVFACIHNAGRSQMAEAFFELLANPTKARATSAGTSPGPCIHPEVVVAMRELGIDLSSAAPRRLTTDLERGLDLLVTMGCGEACAAVPASRCIDWPLDDPKGRPLEEVRRIRDEIQRRVATLVTQRGWAP